MSTNSETLTQEGEMRVNSREDVVDIRQKVRELCNGIGFSLSETTRVVTATSELARNIIEFAGSGKVCWKKLSDNKEGIELVFEDEGPGIDDLEWAMRDGTSTGDGLGKGLPGADKLMDEMEVNTEQGSGTRISVRKWLTQPKE